MARFQPVISINFCIKKDPELIAKINAVSPYMYRCAHDLVRFIVLEKLNQLIAENKIDINYQQPPSVDG